MSATPNGVSLVSQRTIPVAIEARKLLPRLRHKAARPRIDERDVWRQRRGALAAKNPHSRRRIQCDGARSVGFERMRHLDVHDDSNGAIASAPCPFCEIVAGRRRQEIVYADDTVVGFLCEPPATWGHVLIVPRQHRTDIWEIPSEEAGSAIVAAKLVAEVVRSELGAVGVNLRQNSGSKAGQDVFHFHLHVVPRYSDDTLLAGCVWGMPPWEPPTGGDAERQRVAEAIRRGIEAHKA
jgi:histidine triad (HIT) family protein